MKLCIQKDKKKKTAQNNTPCLFTVDACIPNKFVNIFSHNVLHIMLPTDCIKFPLLSCQTTRFISKNKIGKNRRRKL